MPFVSQAQRNLFYARPELRKYIAEYEAATPNKKLPVRLHPKHPALKKKRQRRPKHKGAEHYTELTRMLTK